MLNTFKNSNGIVNSADFDVRDCMPQYFSPIILDYKGMILFLLRNTFSSIIIIISFIEPIFSLPRQYIYQELPLKPSYIYKSLNVRIPVQAANPTYNV